MRSSSHPSSRPRGCPPLHPLCAPQFPEPLPSLSLPVFPSPLAPPSTGGPEDSQPPSPGIAFVWLLSRHTLGVAGVSALAGVQPTTPLTVFACRPFNLSQQVNAFLGYGAVRRVEYEPQKNPTRLVRCTQTVAPVLEELLAGVEKGWLRFGTGTRAFHLGS